MPNGRCTAVSAQVALLREFRPGLDAAVAEPLGEALRAGLGAVALWWLDHPEVPRSTATRAVVHLAAGVVKPILEESRRP